MKKLFRLFLVLFLGLVPTFAMAQLTLTGELRPRTELRNGFGSLIQSMDDPGFFTSQRTRLNFNYSDEKYRVGVSVQDVRVWGDVPQLNKSDNYKLTLHEAWGELIFSDAFSLKVGRQELVYDDSRILGNVGWAQQARSHDLALFKFKTDESGKLHLGFAVNNDAETRTKPMFYTTSYKNMQFAWYNRKNEKFDFSLLFLNSGWQQFQIVDNDVLLVDDLGYQQTFGTHFNIRPGKVALTGSVYAQTGKDAFDRDLKAYMFNVGAKFPVADNWKGNVGIEMLSGTDSNEQSVAFDNKSFTPLFGTNHKFNGHMDYFYVGNHVGDVGLQDIYGGLNYAKDKISFASAIHVFSTQADLMDGTGTVDKYLGTEVDLSFCYKYSKSVKINVGYSHMFASDSMDVLKGAVDSEDLQNWAWVMVTFKPTFLKK